MSCDMLEFSMRAEIIETEISSAISHFFSLNTRDVLDEDEFWANDFATDESKLGIKVYSYEMGFRTRACVVANFTISDETFEQLAIYFAKLFNTEVAIGNFRKSGVMSQDLFLVYFSDGRIAEAIDNSVGGSQEIKIMSFI